MRHVRPAVKAVIIRDGHLLVTHNRSDDDPDGEWFLLPGGGVEHGETLPEAMRRECWEEVGCDVEVHDIVMVRDYIAVNHEFADHEGHVHGLEIMFRCTLLPGSEPRNGTVADIWQTGVDWLPLDQLEHYRLYPAAIRSRLTGGRQDGPIYLGDVN